MNDLKASIVANLQEATGWDVYYENIMTPLQIPCITYLPIADIADKESENIRYSRPAFRIKIWGNDLQTLEPIAHLADEQMFEDGFTRIGYNEITYNGQIQIIMTYQSLYVEQRR